MAVSLELDTVRKSFNGTVAVDDLSLSVTQGNIFGLLGPNGAGKTSTIRIMIGILLPDSGVVRIFGEPFSRISTRKMGYLPEERGLYRKMTVEENLMFVGELAGLSGRVARERGRYWTARLGLEGSLKRKVEELSKGNQQKIQFMAALVHDPALIVMDEPFGGLDPLGANELKDIVLELKRQGRTILLSTHRMEQAEKLCDEICLINHGKVIASGGLRELKQSQGVRSIAIELEGSIKFHAENPLVEKLNDFGNYGEITLRPYGDSQEVLRAAMAKARVVRFEVREPSLEEIFIGLIGKWNA
jgi:ABC-2 type transport system ATP-binding protein